MAAAGSSLLAAVTAEQAFVDADVNHDGVLSFDEFKRWYMQNMGTKVGSSGPASTPADRNFKLRVPRATYCYLCSTDGTGRRTHRSLNSIDPSIKGFYKDDYLELGLDKGDLDTSKDLAEAPEEDEEEEEVEA